MEHAIKIAARIIASLPQDKYTPETTELKEPFIHPTGITGSLESATVNFILRAFDTATLKEMATIVDQTAATIIKDYPNSSYKLEVFEQYRNMKEVLDKHPQVVDFALEAIARAGMKPQRTSIRGGTDGSRLSYMGLPCPNIFAGEHAFHSRLEWVSVQDMQKAVDTIVHLVGIWEEKS
jgi:tripeptide aminopeptidase